MTSKPRYIPNCDVSMPCKDSKDTLHQKVFWNFDVLVGKKKKLDLVSTFLNLFRVFYEDKGSSSNYDKHRIHYRRYEILRIIGKLKLNHLHRSASIQIPRPNIFVCNVYFPFIFFTNCRETREKKITYEIRVPLWYFFFYIFALPAVKEQLTVC